MERENERKNIISLMLCLCSFYTIGHGKVSFSYISLNVFILSYFRRNKYSSIDILRLILFS